MVDFGRLDELGIEREIRIEIVKQVRSGIGKRIWNEIEKPSWNEIEKRIGVWEISESEAKLEPSLGVKAERAIPNHPRPKMKKSLKALWSVWT